MSDSAHFEKTEEVVEYLRHQTELRVIHEKVKRLLREVLRSNSTQEDVS